MKSPNEWIEEDLLGLISRKQEENLQLEFKRANSLLPTDKNENKIEISKDVSSFANSIGGTIVYGIAESSDKPSFASELTPIDPGQVSKEWLEQVINSRIHPRIQGIVVNPVELRTTHTGKFAYVLSIPQSATAHQASDKRYYKRYNFQSVAMEDYEIRQTINRTSHPTYRLKLYPAQINDAPGVNTFRLGCSIENASAIVGHDVSAVIFLPRHLVLRPDDYQEQFNGVEYTRLAGVWMVSSHDSRSAVDSAHPLTAYHLNFQQEIKLLSERYSLDPLRVIVRIFDQFGLALEARYSIRLPGLETVLIDEARTDRLLARPATLA